MMIKGIFEWFYVDHIVVNILNTIFKSKNYKKFQMYYRSSINDSDKHTIATTGLIYYNVEREPLIQIRSVFNKSLKMAVIKPG